MTEGPAKGIDRVESAFLGHLGNVQIRAVEKTAGTMYACVPHEFANPDAEEMLEPCP